MGRLAGKIAFISGTGAGIGRAAALIFAAEGTEVFGCDIDEDSAAGNASALRNGPFGTTHAEDWCFTIKNELDIAYFCTQAASPHLIARGGGAVLNVASVAAVRGAPFMPMVPHGAAKGGVSAMSLHLCAAGAPHHIRANTIGAAFLCSDEAAFVNGADLMVDGGDSAMAG
ncbi:SDR family NAD(P)-dependent oxidoreductase [Streptomyces sp. NPDC048504]|uniref:SDR family NAD(P)-dependent oxidoreductase n=1 Tax=Streptomyces sp. NPDC048504 TaxID=3365559 RepID=UPI00371C36A9